MAMGKIVECVPNFSEGRDASKVAEIEGAIRGVTGVVFLDSQMDADHNRSVITFAGEPDAVAQQVEQRVACVGEYRALLAVDRAGHECLHACSCSAAQHSARARAVSTATSERR